MNQIPLHRWTALPFHALALAFIVSTAFAETASASTAVVNDVRRTEGDGSIALQGELRQWHAIALNLAGPFAHERDRSPNPFLDYRFSVHFTHEASGRVYSVPGYFAADGAAAETGAESGSVWRAHLSPDQPGRWSYRVAFVAGAAAAVDPAAGEPVTKFDGLTGSFVVAPSDRKGPDFRRLGRLEYVGAHHLRFAGTGDFFLKAGADAPETLLAYVDFDGTSGGRPNAPLKTWQPHVQDWAAGDPTWRGGRGKGLIGALNYLAAKGMNAFSFLTYNAGGDGDNVWPFVERDAKFHYDCSKLDQWNIVFSHAQRLGLFLHFKLQENEIDDHRFGINREPKIIPEALDGGALGLERKVYLREMVARFGHHLALNWNVGEENTQSYEEQRDMVAYLALVDPYNHPIVLHTFPRDQDDVYPHLLGANSAIAGPSLQNEWDSAHRRTVQWLRASEAAARPWVVASDEQGPADFGVPPDPGYDGFSGRAESTDPRKTYSYDLHDIRKYTLWGALMAGGAGVEYYFGYRAPQNDLTCEDFRSRDQSWDYARIALEFFASEKIPFWRMRSHDSLVGNPQNDNARYCFASPNKLYLVYLPTGGAASLDLTAAEGSYRVEWFNPREGGPLHAGTHQLVRGGAPVDLGLPPLDQASDWLAVVRRIAGQP